MGMKLSRGPKLDISTLKKESETIAPEYLELREKAIELLQDKKNLEEAIEKIQASVPSERDTERIIDNLRNIYEKLEEQYQREVYEKEKKLNDKQREIIDHMHTEAEAFQEQSDDLHSLSLKQSALDTKAAGAEAEAKKRELNEMEEKEIERLRLQIQTQEQLRREMQSKNISRGR